MYGLDPFCFVRVFSRDLSRLEVRILSSLTSFSFICFSFSIFVLYNSWLMIVLFVAQDLVSCFNQTHECFLVRFLLRSLQMMKRSHVVHHEDHYLEEALQLQLWQCQYLVTVILFCYTWSLSSFSFFLFILLRVIF